MTEDEMVGRHRQLNGYEFEQAPGDSVLQSWGHKESDMTEQLNSNNSHLEVPISTKKAKINK